MSLFSSTFPARGCLKNWSSTRWVRTRSAGMSAFPRRIRRRLQAHPLPASKNNGTKPRYAKPGTGRGGQDFLAAFFRLCASSADSLQSDPVFRSARLLQTPAVLYCAVDTLIPLGGKAQPGFDNFGPALDHGETPAVWFPSRSRLQIDDPRRKMDHRHPFIAEGGC